jgi:hypothetical protein
MIFLQYRLIPADEHPRRDSLGEALVNCWIDRPTADEADALARAGVEAEHWLILEREEAADVSAADYENDDDWREHYEQALSDGEVYVYHLSPRHPVYWVTLAVEQRTPAESGTAQFFLCGDAIATDEEDVYDPNFWAGEPRQVALDAARHALDESGWDVAEVVAERGCAPADVPEDLAFAYDEAEESGSCLVFEREGDPEQSGWA